MLIIQEEIQLTFQVLQLIILNIPRTQVTNAVNDPANMITAAESITVQPGETATITLQATVNSGTLGNITNTANVTADTIGTTSDTASNNVVDPCTDGATAGTVTTNDPDADGINNVCDLDDDNDGILDTVECNGTLTPATFVLVDDGVLDGNEAGTIALPSGGTGTWDITHAFTNGEIEQYALSTNNELYFFYDDDASAGTTWTLDNATFSIASTSGTDLQIVLHGYIDASGQVPNDGFGSRFSNYTITWTGGGNAIINDPINQLNLADGSAIASGTTFTQTALTDNDLLEWSVALPLGATNFTISADNGAAFEGF